MEAYRRKIKSLVKEFQSVLGLHQYRMTRLYIGIPHKIRRELDMTYRGSAGYYACMHMTGPYTFVLSVARSIPEKKLRNIIAHEMAHVLLNRLVGQLDDIEVACNRVASAVERVA